MDTVQAELLKSFRPQFLKREREYSAFAAGGDYTLDVYNLGLGRELLVLTLRRQDRQLLLSVLKVGGVRMDLPAVESSPEPAA